MLHGIIRLSWRMYPGRVQKKSYREILRGMTSERILPGQNGQCSRPKAFRMLQTQLYSAVLLLFLEKSTPMAFKALLARTQRSGRQNSPGGCVRPKLTLRAVRVSALRERPPGQFIGNRSSENHQGLTGPELLPVHCGE